MESDYKRWTYFPGNVYKTPETKKRKFWDKLVLGTRIYFVLRYIRAINVNARKALAGVYDREAWAESSIDILNLTEDCGARYNISGLDNLHELEGPAVFVSNHMSTLETMVYPGIIAPEMPVTFVVKESLMTAPLFGPVMRSREPITVKRENVREDLMAVMSQGQEKLKEGTSIIIFPQSTRTVNFNPKEFNSMGIKLAQKAKVKVVPMAIKSDFWGNGKLIKEFGKLNRKKTVFIEIGKPFAVSGNGKEDHERVTAWISERLEQWNKIRS
ncbi:lysophospholipid acyltransferase family protein [Saccharicrinis sp. FJH2]|uniref:lysophospholipid acyltransferase family protein n=1 Tax=Saccharicrinis sp. FJH65 TaxID=3344659 RepID=UPI0035F2E4B9